MIGKIHTLPPVLRTSGFSYRNIEELKGKNDPETLKAVAKEMEALFAYEMIKAMRKTAETSSQNSFGNNTYMSMFDMELAKLFADKGLGLQDMLVKGLNMINNQGSVNKNHNFAENKIPKSVHENSFGPLPQSFDPQNVSETQKPLSELSLPVRGTISSYFGMRKHPIYGTNRFHYGIDIAAPAGTDIYPIKNGRVIFSGEQYSYGNIVIIDHGDGYISKYAHNQVNLVKTGDNVDTNTVIAQVGNTGSSTGPHLHFEVSYMGERLDPFKVIAMK